MPGGSLEGMDREAGVAGHCVLLSRQGEEHTSGHTVWCPTLLGVAG